MDNNKSVNIVKFLLPVFVIIFIGSLYIFAPERIGNGLGILTPILGAVFIAYLLDSFVRILGKHLKINRGISVLIVYGILVGIVTLFLYKIIPTIVTSINEVVDFAVNTDSKSFISTLHQKFDYNFIDDIVNWIEQFGSEIREFINSTLVYLSNWLIKLAGGVASKIIPIFSTFVLSIYMLLEKDDLLARAKRMIYAFLNKENADYTMNAFGHGNRIFKSFLVGKILDSLVVGIIAIIVFSVLRVPQALLLGTIIGFSNIIPYFGPIIGAVPAVTITLFIAPHKAIVVLVSILLIGQLDANFIDPKIVGKNTGVSAFWTITSVTIGGAAFGFVGVILSVPTVVLIKTLIEEGVEKRLIAKGMKDYEVNNIKVIGAPKDKIKKPKTKKEA
ncbi:MAG: AI-2E family transporter [Filifactoraceae bacterium]